MTQKSNEEQSKAAKKCEEIFILMNLAKMTLTEINTLSNEERYILSEWFKQQAKKEKQSNKHNLDQLYI
jgi:hypothetical protein